MVLVIVVGAYALWSFQGMLLQTSSAAENNPEVVDGVQVVNSTLQSGRYPNITVQAGVPVRWVIDAPDGSINGCNNRILIQDYGIEYTFHTGENVIEFTPVNVGTVYYSCWMGMIRGNIFVTDGTGGGCFCFWRCSLCPAHPSERLETAAAIWHLTDCRLSSQHRYFKKIS